MKSLLHQERLLYVLQNQEEGVLQQFIHILYSALRKLLAKIMVLLTRGWTYRLCESVWRVFKSFCEIESRKSGATCDPAFSAIECKPVDRISRYIGNSKFWEQFLESFWIFPVFLILNTVDFSALVVYKWVLKFYVFIWKTGCYSGLRFSQCFLKVNSFFWTFL